MICRDGLVGVASQTAPTNGLEPPLQTLCDVVHVDDLGHTFYRSICGNSSPPPQSPWDLGCSYTIDLAKASDIRKKLSFVEDVDE